MGRIESAFNQSGRVDLAAVKSASVRAIDMVLSRYLPGGRRHGAEYTVVNPTRGDNKPGSFKINTQKGVWSDFATGETGGDPIDLVAYVTGKSIIEAAKDLGELLGVPLTNSAALTTPAAQVVAFPSGRASTVLPPSDVVREPGMLPPRTQPNADNRPRFFVEEEPRVFGDELRRHRYLIGTVCVKIKIMRKGNQRAMIWFKVIDIDGRVGWQAQKPEGWRDVPFIGSICPFSDGADGTIYWPEGEKDTENLAKRGFPAFSFGGGDGLPAGVEEYARGRDLIILADNDPGGFEQATEKANLAAGVAKSVRVIYFRDLGPGEDVSDFFDKGGTAERLQEIILSTPLYQAPVPNDLKLDSATSEHKTRSRLKATAYSWIDPENIPKRDWIYGKHLIRKFVSATLAPGGVGKSSLLTTEALAMVSGINLLGIQPSGRCRVWLWNLEDPAEEITRHVQATAKYFNLKPSDLEGYLFVDSGRDQSLVTAVSTPHGVEILQPVIDALVAELIARQIDVLIIDPFVSSHGASENDNNAMDAIIKAWGRVAHLANCAIELVHHTRKNSSGETEITVESSRGGKALTDGCRSVRVLNRMSEKEGEQANVENPRLHFRTYIDKGNLAPPADKSDWFKLNSVDLENGINGGFGDSVGVVAPWQWPDQMADVTVQHLRAVQTLISRGQYRANVQAADWAGKAVAEACNLDLNDPAKKRKAGYLLKVWLGTGALREESRNDGKGNPRPFIVVGEWAND